MPLSGSTESSTHEEWGLDIAPTFERGYRSKDKVNRQRVDQVLEELVKGQDPETLGIAKNTPDGRVIVYEIGRKYRLSYRVNRAFHEIDLIRVCDHKAVYGRD